MLTKLPEIRLKKEILIPASYHHIYLDFLCQQEFCWFRKSKVFAFCDWGFTTMRHAPLNGHKTGPTPSIWNPFSRNILNDYKITSFGRYYGKYWPNMLFGYLSIAPECCICLQNPEVLHMYKKKLKNSVLSPLLFLTNHRCKMEDIFFAEIFILLVKIGKNLRLDAIL